MAIRADAPEPAVDELRRRARRRLVGAVVLALAAAVLLPLLLESEPKPLGDDVSIQIPPIDSGKFINPLSSAKAPDPKIKGSVGRSGAEPSESSPTGEPQPSKSGEAPASAPPPPAPAEAKAGEAEGNGAAASAAKTAIDTPASTRPAPAAAARADTAGAGSGYVVQVAAFSDHYGANSLATKLKRSGFPGYTEAVTTDTGTTLHRVRVGPYASREAADAALAKLKAAGFSGMVTHVG
jgi:DedD protein